MLNHSASLVMSTSVLKALPGKLDIKRQSPSILYLLRGDVMMALVFLMSLGCMGFTICEYEPRHVI